MWIAAISVLSALLSVATSWGTSFVEQPFPDSVRDAPNVARVRITDSGEARWSEDASGMRRLYTYYEASVEDVLKGTLHAGEAIELRVIGGEKDGTRVSIPGVATFVQNEESVLMLSSPHADGSYDVFGLMMGKYALKNDEHGEEYLSGAGISPTADPSERWTIARVKDLIQEQRSTPAPADPKAVDPSAPIQHPGGAPTSKDILSEEPEGPALSDRSRTFVRGLPASQKLILGIAIGALLWFFWRRRKSR